MTGGQPVEGALTVPQITRQVAAEGVERIAVVTDEPGKYRGALKLPDGVPCTTATNSTRCSASCASIDGVSVLVYDQTCAAEKRRRRKRGTYPDPAKRVVINELVCEGCGDCSAKSNCLSVVPVETEYGRKREIDQSSCNKDYSCVKASARASSPWKAARLRKGRPREPSAGTAAATCRSRRCPRSIARTGSSSPASAARAWSRSARCSAWPRRWKARA